MLFIDGSRISPLVTFAPHPNPPPRRGEGRVGVMLLEIFMQRLGLSFHTQYFGGAFSVVFTPNQYFWLKLLE